MFTNLSQDQIAGLFALLVSTPFLIKFVRNFYLANASKQWPKVSGTILKISNFGQKYSVRYEYKANKNTYKGHRICFTSTSSPINKSYSDFEEKYALDKIVDVFYNPNKPKQAVLEPGRKDGLLTAILFMGALFVMGCLELFNPGLFWQLIGNYV